MLERRDQIVLVPLAVTPGFEQFLIIPVPDGYAKRSLPEGIRQLRREHQAEQRGGEDATLFYSIGQI